MDPLYILIGAVFGVLVVVFINKYTGRKTIKDTLIAETLRKQLEEQHTRNQVLQQTLTIKEEELKKSFEELRQEREKLVVLTGEVSAKKVMVENLDAKLRDQKKEIEASEERLRKEFEILANRILEEKTQKFTEQNKSRLDEILKPLGEKIKSFQEQVVKAYQDESKQRFSLQEEVKRLADLNKLVMDEANNLARALKGESKTMGTWGEFILESILEKSGLEKGREYIVQPSFTDDQGRRSQPDVVVVYPGNRNIVIDSKVSLTDYERFSSADNEKERERALSGHLASVKTHVKELSEKKYQDLYQLNSLDFVMMFVPVEPAYLLAIHHDKELWSYAYTRRILIIGPTNLIAALKMVESMWQQEFQSRNVKEIARQSGALYDKFAGMVDDLKELGKKMNMAQRHYEASMNKLSTGKGSLVSRVEKIKQLGAKTTKDLPRDMVDKALDESGMPEEDSESGKTGKTDQ
ncbi:MAG: DNA recombination protein RmuC [Chlorobi bacterium]|nr:DNA recombination protein RmuC [Chlorobiota bacterium]